jgi:hypothetical protein
MLWQFVIGHHFIVINLEIRPALFVRPEKAIGTVPSVPVLLDCIIETITVMGTKYVPVTVFTNRIAFWIHYVSPFSL